MAASRTAMLLALAAAFGATPALADRDANAEERAAIEKVLRAQGFVSWEEIELDDGRWEVDDARDAKGVEYDLKIDPKTLKIVRKEEDAIRSEEHTSELQSLMRISYAVFCLKKKNKKKHNKHTTQTVYNKQLETKTQ